MNSARLQTAKRYAILAAAIAGGVVLILPGLPRWPSHETRLLIKRIEDSGGWASCYNYGYIRVVSIQGAGASDDQLAGLLRNGELARLRGLYLSDTSAGSLTVQAIAGLGRLEYLDLSGTCVQDSDIGLLASHTSLCNVDVSRTSVSDTSINVLLSMPHLSGVALEDTLITENGVDRLSSQPGLHIRH